jgi:hypothetical protein
MSPETLRMESSHASGMSNISLQILVSVALATALCANAFAMWVILQASSRRDPSKTKTATSKRRRIEILGTISRRRFSATTENSCQIPSTKVGLSLTNHFVESDKRSESHPGDDKENDAKIDPLHILITAVSRYGSPNKIPAQGRDTDGKLASNLVRSTPTPTLHAGTLAT